MADSDCPFCHIDRQRLFFEGESIYGIWDAFPISPGHALLATKRHVASWFEATSQERSELAEATAIARAAVLERHTPDGYNIGLNDAEAAGQTIPHLHVHVIPRYSGDVVDPTGGVRAVIPGKANYLGRLDVDPPRVRETALRMLKPDFAHSNSLVGGGDDPLLPHLISEIDTAANVDIAVGFVLATGVDLLFERLSDLLDRGGSLRILTGDYLDVTEPRALLRLLDLEGAVTLRVFEAREISFHPKSYIFGRRDGAGVAYVGSSNLTNTALRVGIEWNYRIISSSDIGGFRDVQASFEDLFRHPATTPLSLDWVQGYSQRRTSRPIERATGVAVEPPEPPPQPHRIQREALEALKATRANGNTAGLVVLATGLGKTWLSAFDCDRPEFRRVLFVAHREEILAQARRTFRRIRPEATLGLYTGKEKFPDADVVFASIQTLGRDKHLREFDYRTFDYIIVDEFHHAAARTYRKLLDHFAPKFLLGLTATPDRTDGASLLALCQENLIYRCDFFDGIELGLLCPFHYFGVPDEVDYTNIPWRSSRFDDEALTMAVSTQARAQNVLEQYRMRAGTRTLAFCCSTLHADFMAEFFRSKGILCEAVHSGPTSASRTTSLERLEAGELHVICSVDMFNEGVDLPHVDSVMMLRPTESSIVWLQQMGRGLRTAAGKSHLTIIDYIGNHRSFLIKPRTLFQLGPGDAEINRALSLLAAGGTDLPPGCEVTYDLEAVDILTGLLRLPKDGDAVEAFYEDFRERNGIRPTAVEALNAGYNPTAVRRRYGSWLGLVKAMGDLSSAQAELIGGQPGEFLLALETTPMTKSYKMLTLLALLNADRLPGGLSIEDLVLRIRKLLDRYPKLRDVEERDLSDDQLRALIERNPIEAWVGGRGTSGHSYFSYEDQIFRTSFKVPDSLRADFQELVREIVDWRLAAYLAREARRQEGDGNIVCKVSHSKGRPILFLPDRAQEPGIPYDWTPVEADDRPYEAKFVKIAVNVIRSPGLEDNVLPQLLRGWFGPDVGLPGTSFYVVFEGREDGTYEMRPLSEQLNKAIEPWRSYAREQIPVLWGFEFAASRWNQGFLVLEDHVFLLVTLEKGDLGDAYQYRDRFLSADLFQWQSQNRTTQGSNHGQIIQHHEDRGYEVHLFVRRAKREQGRAAPFIYCGEVDFVDCEGEKPLTVRWRMREPVPEAFHSVLMVPET